MLFPPQSASWLKEGVETTEVETWLNTHSDLPGVSERSSDMRELLEAAGQGDAGAELAVEMFCYRVRKYIASYLAVLNGADAVLFGGGIGENAPEVRASVPGWTGVGYAWTQPGISQRVGRQPASLLGTRLTVSVLDPLLHAPRTHERLRRLVCRRIRARKPSAGMSG
jgi:acetate kinase